MGLFLDSAIIREAEEAMGLGYVAGVTTNPLLMKNVDGPWRDTLKKICNVSRGSVFYQIDSVDTEKLVEVTRSIHKISPDQIVVKLPAVPLCFKAVAEVAQEIPCCVTAVYSVAQLVAAQEASARYCAVYVNRSNRFYEAKRDGLATDGTTLVREMREIIDKHNWPIEILAASLKTSNELVAALKAGAHHVTAGLDVLKSLTSNPLSEEALAEFNCAL